MEISVWSKRSVGLKKAGNLPRVVHFLSWIIKNLVRKQARDFFRNILCIISSKVVFITEKWDNWQKIYGKIRNKGVAQNNTPCSSQMKEEFTCLCCCGCHQHYTTSPSYKRTRRNCKVTNFTGVQMLIFCLKSVRHIHTNPQKLPTENGAFRTPSSNRGN